MTMNNQTNNVRTNLGELLAKHLKTDNPEHMQIIEDIGKLFDPKGIEKSDIGLARAFIEKINGEKIESLIFCDEYSKWYHRKMCNQVYDYASPVDMQKLAIRHFYTYPKMTKSRINAIIELSRCKAKIDVSKIDSNLTTFGTNNGSAHHLESHDDSFITMKIGTNIDKEATCPLWLQFLDQIFDGSKELVDYVQRAVGYSLTGHVREHCLFLLHGRGKNGKSTFLNVLKKLCGDYATSLPMHTLMVDANQNQTNDLAKLVGKRLVVASEGNRSHKFNEAKIKSMTGGDDVTARFHFKEYFDYKPQFKLWVMTNHLPNIEGSDDAIWRRIHLIPFERQFNGKDCDEKLEEKLSQELPGILNWAIEGYRQWAQQGLNPPDIVMKSTQEYRDESDLIGQWIAAKCELQSNLQTNASDLYISYLNWCDETKVPALSKIAFGRDLSNRGITTKHRRDGWVRIGVGFRHRDEKLANIMREESKVIRFPVTDAMKVTDR